MKNKMSESRISVFQKRIGQHYYNEPVFQVPNDQIEYFGADKSTIKAVLMPEKHELEITMYRGQAVGGGVRVFFNGENSEKYLDWLHQHLDQGEYLRVDIMAENDIVLHPIGALVN